MDKICNSILKCFLVIFVGSYLIWWLVLDGPKKWDQKFGHEIKGKELPILLDNPFKYNK